MRTSREVPPAPSHIFDELPGIIATPVWILRDGVARREYTQVAVLTTRGRVPEDVRQRLALHPVTRKTPEEHERRARERERHGGALLPLRPTAGAYGFLAALFVTTALLLVAALPVWASLLSGALAGVAACGIAEALKQRAASRELDRCLDHDVLVGKYEAVMLWPDGPELEGFFEPLLSGMSEVQRDLGDELSSALEDSLVAILEWRQVEVSTRAGRHAAAGIVSRAHGDDSPEVVAVGEWLEELRGEMQEKYEAAERLRDAALSEACEHREKLRSQGKAKERERARMEARMFLGGGA